MEQGHKFVLQIIKNVAIHPKDSSKDSYMYVNVQLYICHYYNYQCIYYCELERHNNTIECTNKDKIIIINNYY